MNIAKTIPVAYSGMHGGGWWILGGAVMMGCMGAMMWMMMRGMGGGSSAPTEPPDTTQSALEILERRFAQGEISAAEYRERRDILASGGDESNGPETEEPLPTPSAGERREQ